MIKTYPAAAPLPGIDPYATYFKDTRFEVPENIADALIKNGYAKETCAPWDDGKKAAAEKAAAKKEAAGKAAAEKQQQTPQDKQHKGGKNK